GAAGRALMPDIHRRALNPDLTATRTVEARNQAGVGTGRHALRTPRRGKGSDRRRPAPPVGDAMSAETHDLVGFGAAPFLVQIELLERRLVAGDEQEHRILVRAVDVLEPRTARHRERVELLPVEALAIDDRM